MTTQPLIDQALAACNGVGGLASQLGLKYGTVHQWKTRGVPLPWQRVIRSEILKQKQPTALVGKPRAALKKEAA